ncbi:MAG: CBS domain-containing protein [Clostridia bacterium]|nr:CBS domain-containing protein [Clostridia bacterium]
MGLTKHEVILRYIRDLAIGSKVSVRQIAKELDVSEGTAYRAIKEAENQGWVSSIPKVGTIRIEDDKKELEDLSLREIALIVEGEIISGHNKLGFVPDNFIVGASSKETLLKYLNQNVLFLIGDNQELQELAVKLEVPMLLTGGFSVNEKLMAQIIEKNIPLVYCPYETFIAITLINNAVSERLKIKELIRIEDIMIDNPYYLKPEQSVNDWHVLAEKTGHSRFPVIDSHNKVVGIITAIDVAGKSKKEIIDKVMNKNVLTTKPNNLVTHLSRLLIWESFELIPVTDDDNNLLGVVSRQDILNSFQQLQKQPQFGETIDNLTLSGFKLGEYEDGIKIFGEITQFMVNESETASTGVLTMILHTASYIAIKKQFRWNTQTEAFSLYQFAPIEVGEFVEVFTKILLLDKKSAVLEVELYSEEKLKAKATATVRMVKK